MTEPTSVLVYGNGRQAGQLLAELAGDDRYRVLAVTADADYVHAGSF